MSSSSGGGRGRLATGSRGGRVGAATGSKGGGKAKSVIETSKNIVCNIRKRLMQHKKKPNATWGSGSATCKNDTEGARPTDRRGSKSEPVEVERTRGQSRRCSRRRKRGVVPSGCGGGTS
ncbi:hypothetical protein C2845_PM03G12990 [Panicum miliaceum]|uniref:Uncharacterized protein n=1 Tax=Panicum miliaceum TaxID=4540 RepID=A0A3L6T9N8_PANMI|nr:hypothetical protein C2845_PM03G12990 [Panicum miliaceum]